MKITVEDIASILLNDEMHWAMLNDYVYISGFPELSQAIQHDSKFEAALIGVLTGVANKEKPRPRKKQLRISRLEEDGLLHLGNLKTERKLRGLSQTELSQILGIRQTTVSRYEAPRKYCSLSVYLKMARYFGWTVNYDLRVIEKRSKRSLSETYDNRYPFTGVLRDLLTNRGMTLEVFGRAIGVTKQSVSQYVLGNHLPSIPVLMKIADLFHVSFDYLLTGQENETGGE